MRAARYNPPMTRSSLIAVLSIAAAVVVVASPAGAFRPAAYRPISVGTVDLGQVLEKVNERAEWDATLKGMGEKLSVEVKSRQEAIQAKQAKVKEMPDGDERTRLREELALEILEAEAWLKFKSTELDRERSLMWQDLYKSVKAEADKLAVAEGFDLVLVNDSLGELRTTPDANTSNEGFVLQQITARRALYASKEIDLTDRLIVRMNNARATAPKRAPQ